MPVVMQCPIHAVSQQEFSAIAYQVMATVFAVHRDFGRLFEEKIYQYEIAERLGNAQLEFPITVVFDKFAKTYFIDLVVDSRAIFELKAADAVVPRHRAQLLHYLMLADVCHGKLINLRPDKVEHEFINTTLTLADRTSFAIEECSWDDHSVPGLKDWIISFLRDLGVGLDLSLYDEAAAYFCSPNGTLDRQAIRNERGRVVGSQELRIVAPEMALQFSAFSPEYTQQFEVHLKRFLSHTSLKAIQWINLARPQVLFKTIRN
jgi:GxxExxY protein